MSEISKDIAPKKTKTPDEKQAQETTNLRLKTEELKAYLGKIGVLGLFNLSDNGIATLHTAEGELLVGFNKAKKQWAMIEPGKFSANFYNSPDTLTKSIKKVISEQFDPKIQKEVGRELVKTLDEFKKNMSPEAVDKFYEIFKEVIFSDKSLLRRNYTVFYDPSIDKKDKQVLTNAMNALLTNFKKQLGSYLEASRPVSILQASQIRGQLEIDIRTSLGLSRYKHH